MSGTAVIDYGQYNQPCPSCGHCPTCGRGGYMNPWPNTPTIMITSMTVNGEVPDLEPLAGAF